VRSPAIFRARRPWRPDFAFSLLATFFSSSPERGGKGRDPAGPCDSVCRIGNAIHGLVPISSRASTALAEGSFRVEAEWALAQARGSARRSSCLGRDERACLELDPTPNFGSPRFTTKSKFCRAASLGAFGSHRTQCCSDVPTGDRGQCARVTRSSSVGASCTAPLVPQP
jgi:hypothetical protein